MSDTNLMPRPTMSMENDQRDTESEVNVESILPKALFLSILGLFIFQISGIYHLSLIPYHLGF